MHITLQQDQHPNPTLLESAYPRSTKFLAFALPGKTCLIYIINDIQPIYHKIAIHPEDLNRM